VTSRGVQFRYAKDFGIRPVAAKPYKLANEVSSLFQVPSFMFQVLGAAGTPGTCILEPETRVDDDAVSDVRDIPMRRLTVTAFSRRVIDEKIFDLMHVISI
jgi:hypothetical protein